MELSYLAPPRDVEIILACPVGHSVITRVLIVEEGDRSECVRVNHCKSQQTIAGVEDGERP